MGERRQDGILPSSTHLCLSWVLQFLRGAVQPLYDAAEVSDRDVALN